MGGVADWDVSMSDGSGRWRRIRAVAARHAFVLRRSPDHLFEVFAWPVLNVVLWGSFAMFAASGPGEASEVDVGSVIAGLLLFQVLAQSHQSLVAGFLDEMWSRNLLNFMATPCTEGEYAAGVALSGLIRVAGGMAAVCAAAGLLYSFSVLDVGWAIVPVGSVLLLAGWSLSLFGIGLLLRFGQSAATLSWGFLFALMPLSGIVYPVDALPAALQPVAVLLPTTHAFAALRAVLDGDPLPWVELAVAAAECVAAGAASAWFVARMLRSFRRRGYITRHT